MINLFTNFHIIKELHEKGYENIPNQQGVYLIIRPETMVVKFNNNTSAITEYNGQDLILDVNELTTKFVKSDRNIIYIGKAGGQVNRLRNRIKQLVRYGYKEVNNHRGGRAVWQIENNKDLLIGYFICENPEEIEKELLTNYLNQYGVLPVANWKIG